MRRVVRPELLDSGDAPPHEVRTSLADLKLINRWFGGISTTKHLIRQAISRKTDSAVSILDVGAATGDGPRAIQESFPQVRFTLLDRDRSHFDGTRALMSCVSADALALPFATGAFDFVTCSLFVHHLEPDEIRTFANEALRVARTALLINDLRRSAIHLGLVYLGQPLFRSRITRHDTVASVQRAYTAAELTKLLQGTKAREVEVHNTYLYRMGAIAWK